MKNERLLNAIGQIDDEFISEAKPELKFRQKKFNVRRFVLLAACFVMILSLSIATPIMAGNREAGTVTMEINPGVEYTITRNGNVKQVKFLNEDAKGALEQVSFKGQKLKTALALTISAYKAVGYMDKNDTVLISFSKELNSNAKLKESLSDNVNKALAETKSVHTVVYATVTSDAEISEIAEKYGISEAKAKLIESAAENSDLSVDDLVKLPLDELVELQKEVKKVVIHTKYIGIIKAKEIALNDAGCVSRVEFTEATLIDGGIKYPYYRLVFNDKHTQWTYNINAVNGEIINKVELTLFISLEEAKKIALSDAGINDNTVEEKVVFTREELSRNQGRPCWILEFYTKEFQYKYKIDAKTGEIIFFDYHIDIRKAREIALTDAGVFADVEKITFTVEEYVGGGIKTPYFYFVFNNDTTQWTYRIDATLGTVIDKSEASLFISLQRAKEIALNDAGITDPNDVIFTVEELNRSVDRSCWVLEFYTKKFQYSYKIDAETGDILFFDYHIDIAKAKEIALKDAEVYSFAEKITFTVEEYVGGGIKTPYFYFVFNNDTTQWTYRIDATLGTVIDKSKAPLFITLQKAKEIALKDAEIENSTAATFTMELLNRNSGRPCWALEFYTEKYQYSYKIDAKSGEIIYNRRYLYIERAREIVLQDASLIGYGKIVFTVETLVDGGIKTPYYIFEFNDDKTQWLYRVDATNGLIIFKQSGALKLTA
mgnify:CR=1 FL=1